MPLLSLFLGVHIMSRKLLAVTLENRSHGNILPMNTARRAVIRWPMTIGSGDVSGIRLSDVGWYRNASSIVNCPNAMTVVSMAIENGTVSSPVYKKGSRTWTIQPGENDSQCDTLFPSALGMSFFPVGFTLWLKFEVSFAATSMQMLTSARLISQISGSQCLAFDNAVTTVVSGVDAVGAFTTSGTAPTSNNFAYHPMVLGTYVAAVDPKVLYASGDSIFEGVGDSFSGLAGGGMFQRCAYGAGGTNILSSINFGKSSATGNSANGATGDYVFYWAQYANIGFDECGTNDIGAGASAATMLTRTQISGAKMRSFGIQKRLRTWLGMSTSSTDSFATDANQTVVTGWGAGEAVATFNAGLAALVPNDFEVVLPMSSWRSGTNQYKWINNGSTTFYGTTDGIHPSALSHTLIAAEMRLAVDNIVLNAITTGEKPMATTWEKTGADSAQHDKNRTFQVSGNLTLSNVDSGKSFIVKSGTSIFTLPSTAPGLIYTVQYQGKDGGGQIQLSPAAADGIGAAGSAVVNKDLILATATIKQGDFVKITSGVGATGVTAWHMIDQRGIVTKEA